MRRLINKKVLFILAILLLVGVFLFSLFLSWSKKTTTLPHPPTPSPVPDNNKIPISNPANKKPLIILESTVPSRLVGLQEGFIIKFSQTPSPSEFLYEITPSATVGLTLEDRIIYVRPRPTWNPDTLYKFTIKRGTKDLYGNLLEKDFTFSFKTVSSSGM